MKVLHFSYLDNKGAGIAAVRYHRLMLSMNIDSQLYVIKKTNSDDDTIISLSPIRKISRNVFFDKIKNKFSLKRKKLFSSIYCYYNFYGLEENGIRPKLMNEIDIKDVDFIFVHWLGDFINSYDIKHLFEATNAKIIFSMMDMEPITGGCHYPWSCDKFTKHCLDCPALQSPDSLLAHDQLLTKAINYSYINADIFSASYYDLEEAKKSVVPFNHYYQLYYPIDEDIFKPSDNIKNNDEITLFANVNDVGDPRKGFNYLLMILIMIDKKLTHKVRFLCLSNKLYTKYKFENIRFEEFAFCKNVNDLVELYRKTDVFLCASIEDSAPMMLQEALLCGVPAISFDTGVGKQFIEDGKDGYVVERYDVQSFADKLLLMIENKPASIRSAQGIHEHMKSICGKKQVQLKLEEILGIRKN